MTIWAITPYGVGKPVGARSILPDWPLADGESFTIEADNVSGLVLAEDGASVVQGPAPSTVPRIISDRQFFAALALMGEITQDEALAAIGPGTIPQVILSVVTALPAPQDFIVKGLLSGATTFDRDHPTVPQLAAALEWTDEEVDAVWALAATL